MTIWILITLLCLAISATLWWGSRSLAKISANAAQPLQSALFNTRLSEIKVDEAAGILNAEEARAQEAEVARRILASSRNASLGLSPHRSAYSLIVALVVPLIAVAIYSKVGTPNLADVPQAQRLANAEANGDLAGMVYKVESHLSRNPNDATGWELLIPNYMSMGRFSDAALAHRQLIAIRGATADLQANLAEVLMMRDQGTMSLEAIAAARAAVVLDRNHSKGRYYQALGLQQEGKREEALAQFSALLTETALDAPWRSAIERQLKILNEAKALPPALSDEQLQSGEALASDDQRAMIVGMVEGLAAKLEANPNDLTGNLRLIRARVVLKQMDEANAALAAARRTFVSDTKSLGEINALATELKLP